MSDDLTRMIEDSLRAEIERDYRRAADPLPPTAEQEPAPDSEGAT